VKKIAKRIEKGGGAANGEVFRLISTGKRKKRHFQNQFTKKRERLETPRGKDI